ncbi:hypothetical protein [Fictibacillus sp. UD]|uniref:hypothetical protein n=1 Tax=Fictibacillus sp. UD TaxID=3038777 RepID=UPI0037479C3D
MTTILNALIEFISNLFSNTGYKDTLDTQKIDRHIEILKEYDWFKRIYEQEKYHRLFFINRHVRGLESKARVNKMIQKPEAQQKFINLLEKQLKN